MPAVKHIALFNFKAGTSQEQIDKVLEELLDLSEMVPGVQDYVAGSVGTLLATRLSAATRAHLVAPAGDAVRGALRLVELPAKDAAA